MSRPPQPPISVTVKGRGDKASLTQILGTDEAAQAMLTAAFASASAPMRRSRRAVRSMDSSYDANIPGAYTVRVVRAAQGAATDANDDDSTHTWDPTESASTPPNLQDASTADNDIGAEELGERSSSTAGGGQPPPTGATLEVTELETKRGCQPWHIAVLLLLVVAVAGGGVGGYLATKATGGSTNGSHPDLADECDFANVPDPSPVLQCSCHSNISVSSATTASVSAYSTIKASRLLSDYSGPDDYCHPENIALWWIAMDNLASNSTDSVDALLLKEHSAESAILKQRYGLALLYLSLGGWRIMDSVWLGRGNECEWQGVTCNAEAQVSEMHLTHLALTGELPGVAFRHLPALTKLDLSNNALDGLVPLELWTATGNLELLDLSGNRFHGTIPDAIAYLSLLTSLVLNTNILDGTIPEALYGITSLRELDLNTNAFTGSLSGDIGLLSKLESLAFDNNHFSGPLPSALGSLTALKQLSGSGNVFIAGTLPTELRFLSGLATFDLSDNSLRGTLPTELGFLVALTSLNLSRNEFSGTLPVYFENLTNLDELILNQNRLTGTLPHLNVTTKLSLETNPFQGTVPREFCSLSKLSLPCTVSCQCCTRNCCNEMKMSGCHYDDFLYLFPSQGI
jgi:Leucine rich repeat